jgi:hypothetical protein
MKKMGKKLYLINPSLTFLAHLTPLHLLRLFHVSAFDHPAKGTPTLPKERAD